MKKNNIPQYVSLVFAEKDAKFDLKKPKSVNIHIKDSETRILSKHVSSQINIPEENNAAVDGYAVNNNIKDLDRIKIIGESKPGRPFLKKVKNGEAIRILQGPTY